jgi:hypothetical protein
MPEYHPGVNYDDPVASINYAAKHLKGLLAATGGDVNRAIQAIMVVLVVLVNPKRIGIIFLRFSKLLLSMATVKLGVILQLCVLPLSIRSEVLGMGLRVHTLI